MALDDAFWPALWKLAMATGTRPELLLCVWFAESDLEPTAENSAGCIGLNQTCPKPNGPGFPSTPAAYKGSPASAQVAWIARQVESAVKLNGGPFQSAARYWQANWMPATLSTAKAPDAVIAGKDGPYAWAYRDNAGLDADKDGRITLQDLGDRLELLVLSRGAPLTRAIRLAYANRPAAAPWSEPELVIHEPAPATPSGAPPSAGPIASGGIGGGGAALLTILFALALAVAHGGRA